MSAARFSMPEKGGEKMEKAQGEEALGRGLFLSVSGEHRFGLDAFLLARFAAPRRGDRVADLGCGCGIIPFLLWRDFRPARVDGVELQPAAVRLFARSVARSGNPPLYPLEADLRRLEGRLPAGAFDLVTCNPPYFRADTGPANVSASARLARQGAAPWKTSAAVRPGCCAAAAGSAFASAPSGWQRSLPPCAAQGWNPSGCSWWAAAPAAHPGLF